MSSFNRNEVKTMVDGKLLFETGIDNSGFDKGINSLTVAAGTAIGNIAANMVSQISDAVAQIPQQMIAVGSGFEASMSQVAATMGITSAAEEFDVLSNAAKEMGETTKFSASQAGEALNYLALAGYDAEKAVSALPTVLNVAAAGGMELAAASDMITDAMSALGLETEQMSNFSDKLAVTAQKSNTSVSQLGEAILTVGGTAKNLAGGVTEMNTVLGILADNGIKGAEGGTALRNVILSLTAPTSTAAKAIDGLGLSVFDNEGKMRSLQDIIYDLNDALGTMTDAERSQALSDIFNKVDLKSVNALLGTSAERFDELSGYIDNCSGAAADMAATMDDNLKGDLTIMQSALEGLGIAAYEKFQEPMRSAVQNVTADIGTLSESLTSGELSDSFDKISESFSNLASSAAEFAANNVIPVVINGLSTIIDYSNEILALIGGIGAAVAVIKIVPAITSAVTAISTANKALVLLSAETEVAAFQQVALSSGMSLTEIAVGLFTKKITLATAAQAAFNAVTQSTMLTVVASTAALAALAAVTIGAALAFKNYVDNMQTAAETDPWLEQSQKNVDALKIEQQAYKDLLATQKEQSAASDAEANNIQRLWSELQNYVDANGNVISSNERASEIIGTLNSAYGMNIEYMNGQIQGYGELADSMDDYIEKLRLEAKIRNMQPAYDEAIVQQEKYNDKRLELERKLNEKIAAFQATDDNKQKGVFAVQIGGLREEIATLDETYEMGKEIISEYESLFSDGLKSSPLADYYRNQGLQAYNAQQEATEELQLSQEEMTAKLKEGWKQAEHDYAIGVIGSEEELIAEKHRIWNEYGDESCSDHWQYYENLIKLQEDYADDIKKANEQAAKEHEEAVKAEWKAIEHQNNIGLLSDEDAYKQKLAFIQKYCPEYSDEWYDYYKDVYDYQQEYADKQLDELKDSMDDQIDVVKDGLKDILSEYKSAYKDIQSNIDSFKNKLLSLGDAFSVVENKNGTKTLKVNNLSEQMAEMRKYTEYVKKLKAQNASQGLIEELTSMDAADGMEFAKNLANMSDADFAQINDYYKERDKLAQELATDLYSSDVSDLNEKLVDDITEQFGMLPEEIKSIGAESVNAFIEGLGAGDLSKQVESFIGNLGTELDNGLDKMFENWNESISESIGDNIYEAGKTSGEDFVKGFNEALAELEAAVTAEQAKITAEYSGETKFTKEKTDIGTADGNNKLVIENKVHTTVEVDGKQLAETVDEYQNIIDRGKGK
ncbi:MAG: phage tail tape measure protein [Oscillospiraceae bacterium]